MCVRLCVHVCTSSSRTSRAVCWFPMDKQGETTSYSPHHSSCVHVRACVRACVCACVCACVIHGCSRQGCVCLLLHDLTALEKDVFQAGMFSPCQSLAYSEIHICVHVCVCECVCERDRDCTEGFCVIVLSAEACREKGHVLSSDHIVYYIHSEGERQRGVREERKRTT